MKASAEKTKVLFLITKSNLGGAQCYVFDLATGLPKVNYEVTVAAGGSGSLLSKLEQTDVKIVPIPALVRDLSLLKELRSIWQIAMIIRQIDPDILHINSSKAGGYGAFLGRLLGVPLVIFTAHGWAFNERRPWWQRIILKCLHWITVLFSHQTICVSEALKSQMTWPGTTRKLRVVHNGRTVSNWLDRYDARVKITKRCPALGTYEHDPWSVTVGELHPTKQHEVTITALKEVVKTHSTLRHIIIGAGEKQSELEALTKTLNLTEHVFFLGSVEDAPMYLKAFDLFALTSRSEAFGLVIIEAAQAGLPIIASSVGGIPEIVTHKKEALLVPSGDARAVAEAFGTVLEDSVYAAELGTAARKRSQDFSVEKMIERTMVCYKT